MRQGWENKPLGEICILQYGKPLPESKRVLDGKYFAFGANGSIAKTNEFNCSEPTLIIGRKGSAGEITLVEDRCWALDVTYYAQFDRSKYTLKFLYYLLSTMNLPSLAKGVKPGINRNEVYSIRVPVPPLPEQHRIVAILDEAFDAIAKANENAEKNLANARGVFEAHLHRVFEKREPSWKEERLGEICEIKPPKSEARKRLKQTDLVSFAPMEDLGINRKFFVPASERTLAEVEGSYTYFADGDVLLAKITPCFENGKLGIAQTLRNGIGFGSSEYIVFRPTTYLNPEFLYYFLLRKQFREDGAKRMLGAVGHKRVAMEFIENTVICLPPLPEQHSIVKTLDTIAAETRKVESIYLQKLSDLDELKKSILETALSGNLTAQMFDYES